jgi:membrane-bound lytic murein transglycosylase B
MRLFSPRTAPKITTAAALLLMISMSCAAQADNEAAVAQARGAFVDRMVSTHHFDRAELTAVLSKAEINQKILDTIAKPAERVVPWYEYRLIFVTPERIGAGVQFWKNNAATIERVAKQYGVAPEMLVAIVGVETYFGTRMGGYRVIDALSTLAFAYPPRAKFFASQLEEFLLLTREEKVDVFQPMGSYAGAMGAGQFTPSSYRAYAVDENEDGHRNIWTDWEDVLGSVANYFKESGWRTGEPVVAKATRPAGFAGPEPGNKLDLDATVGAVAKQGYVFDTTQPADARAGVFSFEAKDGGTEYWVGYHNFSVITRYNRSAKYALAAHQLGQAIRDQYLVSTAGASPAGASTAGAPRDAAAGSRAE